MSGVVKRKIKELGQYFTPKFVAEFMVSLISKSKDALVLDPATGSGVFLSALVEAGFKNIHAYEIDSSLPNYSPVTITYGNFLDVEPEEKYDVIIGNPPYVRWRNIPKEWREKFKRDSYWNSIMNGLSDLTYAFIYHSVNMLKEGGELIFITPIFWTETVHGKRLRDFIVRRGYPDLIINLNEMKIFDKVSSTVIIFKYVKTKINEPVKVISLHTKEKLKPEHLRKVKKFIEMLKMGKKYIRKGIYEAFLHEQFKDGEPWRPVPETISARNPLLSVQFPSLPRFNTISPLGSIAEIGNGMVSGLDKVFQLNIDELAKLNTREKQHIIYVCKAHTLDRFYPDKEPIPYIYVNDVKSEAELRENYPYFYEKLVRYKEQLLKRYNYGRDIPWWHWVFPRNKYLFEEYREKILVPSKERYDTRGYFRFAYAEGLYYATQDVTVICPKKVFREGVKYLLALLNSEPYQEYVIYKGFTRGGVYDFSERPLTTIPIVRIDWSNDNERKIYNEIVTSTDKILIEKNWKKYIGKLNDLVLKLLRRTLS